MESPHVGDLGEKVDEKDVTNVSLQAEHELSCSEDDEDTELLFDGSEDVQLDGVSYVKNSLDARNFRSATFRSTILDMILEAGVSSWVEVSQQMSLDESNIHIHKVSGSLTNAVFFVSLISSTKEEMAPTLLLRIYGPSSGNLVQRRRELHVLHMLSRLYHIGPAILATFQNGRIEEYIPSRALTAQQLRDPILSQWIAMRMRDLHHVDVNIMLQPEMDTRTPNDEISGFSFETPLPASSPVAHMYAQRPNESPTAFIRQQSSSNAANNSSSSSSSSSSSGSSRRSSIHSTGRHSTHSYYEQSPVSLKSSSPFSLGYSSRSGSTSSLNSILSLSEPLVSPVLPLYGQNGSARNSSESLMTDKRTCRSPTLTKTRVRHRRHNQALVLGTWDNITRWVRKSREIVSETKKETSKLFGTIPQPNVVDGTEAHPFSSPEALYEFFDSLELPKFEKLIKAYRRYVSQWEKTHSRAKRVFAHNDTQYGNLLLRIQSPQLQRCNSGHTPLPEKSQSPDTSEPQMQLNATPGDYRLLSVIDFEYASLNPNAYDIANHFCEWRANYHADLSWSLSAHGPYPTKEERHRFLSAYLGTDNEQVINLLDAQVSIWRPASHAMWAVWGLIQAYEDIQLYIEMWRSGRNDPIDISFEYLLYARERLRIFEEEVKPLLSGSLS